MTLILGANTPGESARRDDGGSAPLTRPAGPPHRDAEGGATSLAGTNP